MEQPHRMAKARWRTRHERAMALRADYDRCMADHRIDSRHIIDAERAVFVIGRPESGMYRAEIAALAHGSVLVHGDIDTVLFSYCGYRGWRQKLGWLRDGCYTYAEEKAAIGTSMYIAREFDEDIAITDLLSWRRHRDVSREVAREVLDIIRAGDYRRAQDTLYAETGDAELVFGKVTACRVLMAQAALSRLCTLLDQEEVAAGTLATCALMSTVAYSGSPQ